MKTITLIKPENKIKIGKAEYEKMRDKLINDIVLNAKNIYGDDEEMMLGIESLCDHLKEAAFNKISLELVRGLAGFIHWSTTRITKITASSFLTTIIHDLGEFRRNKNEAWFSPRTSNYDKYLN